MSADEDKYSVESRQPTERPYHNRHHLPGHAILETVQQCSHPSLLGRAILGTVEPPLGLPFGTVETTKHATKQRQVYDLLPKSAPKTATKLLTNPEFSTQIAIKVTESEVRVE